MTPALRYKRTNEMSLDNYVGYSTGENLLISAPILQEVACIQTKISWP